MARITNQELIKTIKDAYVFAIKGKHIIYPILFAATTAFLFYQIEQTAPVIADNNLQNLMTTQTQTSVHYSTNNMPPEMIFPFFMIFITGILLALKGLSILKQTATGDFKSTSLNPCHDLTVSFVLKCIFYPAFISILCIIPITILLFSFLFIGIEINLIEYLTFAMNIAIKILTPLFFMIITEDGGFSDVISPSRYKEYFQRIGIKAYLATLAIIYLIPTILGVSLSGGIGFLTVKLGLLFPIFAFFSLLILTICLFAGYYFIGATLYMTDDFSDNTFNNTSAHPDGIYHNNSELNDARKVYQDGYPDDAIGLLKNALSRDDTPYVDKIDMTQFLSMILEQKGRIKEANDLKKDLLIKTITTHPYDITQLTNLLTEQMDTADFHIPVANVKQIANIYYQQRNYKLSMKIINQFIKDNSSHKLFPEMTLLYIKNIVDSKGSLKKAYKLTNFLIEKYPEHRLAPEFKSYLIKIKSEAITQKNQAS